MKKFRYQTIIITVPSGTVAGNTISKTVELDQNYKRCTGFQVLKIGGTNATELGLKLDGNQVVDFVFSEAFQTTPAVPISERYHPLDMPADGRRLSVDLKPLVNATADNVYQVVLRLEEQK